MSERVSDAHRSVVRWYQHMRQSAHASQTPSRLHAPDASNHGRGDTIQRIDSPNEQAVALGVDRWETASTPGTTPAASRLKAMLYHSVGPATVMCGFIGLFVVGHRYDWQLPKFSELTGAASADVDDWCAEHAVPESRCVECNTSLLPREGDYGWCKEHGVHNCVLHHPELAELKRPPSPEELQRDARRAEAALASTPRKLSNSRCTMYRSRIQFASIDAVQQAGVEVEPVQRQRIVESLSGYGEIVYDPTRKSSLAARVPGNVWSVERKVGDRVQRGDVLAIVDASAVGDLKTELMQALAEERLQQQNVSRLEQARAAIAESRLLDAQAALSKARAAVLSSEQALQNLGLPIDADDLRNVSEREALDALRLVGIPESIQSRMGGGVATANLVPIVAPIDGIVVTRSVSQGEVVDPRQRLFEIADTRQMWLHLNFPMEDVERLVIGQPIRFTADGSRRVVEGELDWISTEADPHTRMVRVRAVLPNPEGRLRDKTFGTGKVILRTEPEAITIPNQAIHWEGCCQIVFVRNKDYFARPDSPKVFQVRNVRLGATQGDATEVIAGVLPGEVIATEGSDVLRAQLLKNGLGAGCCVVEE